MGAWSIRVFVAALLMPITAAASPADVTGRPEQRGRDRARHEQSERVTRVLTLGRHGQLDVSNVSGAIVVRASRGEAVTIEAVKRGWGATDAEARRQLELVDVEIAERIGRVEVRTRYRDGARRHDARVDFTIAVPEATRLTVRSVAGDVDVSGVKGEIDVEAVSGTVRLQEVGAVSRAKTVAGDVTLDGADVDGTLEASSTSGAVMVRRVRARRLELATVSGAIRIVDCTSRTMRARSLSGDVQVAGPFEAGGRYELRSHSGDVEIAVAGAVGFELEAGTFSGDITSDLPLTVGGRRMSRTIGRSVRGVHGDGSAFVDVTTFSGDVIIRKR